MPKNPPHLALAYTSEEPEMVIFGDAWDLSYNPFEESRQFEFGCLEDALSAMAECAASERKSQWQLGAVVASAVDTFGRYGVYRQLASVAGYTTRRLRTFELLHRTFPVEVRYPDQPLLLYEVALQADDPIGTLHRAVEGKMSPRELQDALSQARGEEVSRVHLFSGEAEVYAHGELWTVQVRAGREWPTGDGTNRCHVTLRQIIKTHGEGQ